MGVFFIILSLFTLVNTNVLGSNDSEFQCFVFDVDNNDNSKFGYKEFEMDQDISVKSICLDSCYAYLLDSYHNNIKKVNITNGEIVTSTVISSRKNCWLRDVYIFNDKLIVSDDFDSIFVLDKNMNKLSAVYIPRINQDNEVEALGYSPKYFFNFGGCGDSIIVFVQLSHESILIYDAEFKLISSSKLRNIWPQEYAHGKPFRIMKGEENKYYLETIYTSVPINRDVVLTRSKYDVINIEYNKKLLVCFAASDKKVKLYVRKVK